METSQSPRRVLNAAYRLALRLLPPYAHQFSRRDFTLPQLFACLALREFYGLSYRRVEKLLRDSPQWLADIALAAAPDHNTLWRALDCIVTFECFSHMMDRLTLRFAGKIAATAAQAAGDRQHLFRAASSLGPL